MKQCNQILSQEIMDRIISNQNETIQQNLIEWFKKATYEDVKREKDRGFKFKFTVPIKGIPVPFDFGGADAEQKFKELKEHIDSGEVEQMSMTRTSEFLRENLNTEVVSAWENIMSKVLNHCSPMVPPPVIPPPEDGGTEREPDDEHPPEHGSRFEYGLQYKLDGTGETITIKVYYIPMNVEDSYPVVESFRVIGGECIAGQLEPGTSINNEKVITVKQTSIGDAVLLISTNKQDLDIKFSSNILEPLLMKVFAYQLPITPSHHVYTKKVPKGYKIIGGGFTVGFGRGEFGQPSCIPTSSYPSSLDEWTIKFTSKIEDNTSDLNQTLYLILTTVYDPHNKWDVRIFSKQTRRKAIIECSPKQEYLMVGGGVELKILDGNSESELLNRENYRIGLIANYPKDDHTWEVKLGETDLQRIGGWDLISYAISIKKNGSIKNYVKTQEHSHNVELDDGIFYVTAGGSIINNSTNINTYITSSIHVMNLLGSPTDKSIPSGWSSYPFMGTSSIDISTFVIGIGNADIEFFPLEHS